MIRRVVDRILTAGLSLMTLRAGHHEMIRLGSSYGGWWIPAHALSENSVAYCAGVGEDISFDTALIERFGCRVVALDPTPRAIAFAARAQPDSDRFHFEPVGLGGTDRTARFYSPSDPSHVSHSIVNLQGTSDFFEARLERVATVMDRLGDANIHLLKMDIEGAEHEVVKDLTSGTLRPLVLCIEVDQLRPMRQLRTTIRSLRKSGYRAAKVEGRNVTFVRS